MRVFYSDNDKRCYAWLQELIKDGLIPEGEVCGKSITEIQGADLQGFDRVHLFAGISGWELALQIAGWDPARSLWTASCPCQPFSSAGKGDGADDARNLWYELFRLVCVCRPVVLFGEQVDGAIAHGWLDRVFLDLESEGYACGAAVLPAASVGAPHARHRIFWAARWLDQPTINRDWAPSIQRGNRTGEEVGWGSGSGRSSASCPWNDFKIARCHDGRKRRIPAQPALFPLAHGIPGRVGILRGAGNAIVPQVAATFIRAFLQAEEEMT